MRIVGKGAVSALGAGCAVLADAVANGVDGIRPVRRFSTAPFRATLGGMVPAYDDPSFDGGAMANRLCPRFAAAAITEAVAGLAPVPRTLLVMGASQVDSAMPVHELVASTLDALGWTCPALTVSTACSSSTAAIALGVAALRLGLADRVIAGGADVLVPELYGGFDALGLLTREKCAPFGTIFGTTLGEGAGFLVLERGAGSPAIVGYGLSCDAWHETSPHPHGEGLAIALSAATADIDRAEVDYVNAHGTGTEANDAAEVRAIEAVFGRCPPLSSTKGVLGHAQAAAGALELITTLVALEAGRLPPSPRSAPTRARMPATIVHEPRVAPVRLAVSSSAAFGGSNAVVAIGADAGDLRPPNPVYWHGASATGRHGRGEAAFFEALERESLPTNAPLPSLAGIRVDPRTLDPAAHLLTRAVADALADAHVRPGRDNRDVIGLIGGAVNVSPSTHRAFQASIKERGLGQPSVAAFARMVLNAPAGAAARALGLRGAHTLISAGRGTGLATIVVSVMLLADSGPTHTIAAGVVDEEDAGGAYGAASAVLARAPSPIRVAGFAFAATPEEAEALATRGLGPVDWRDAPDAPRALGPVGSGPAVDGLHRCLSAVRALREGARLAVVVERGDLPSSAIALLREDPP